MPEWAKIAFDAIMLVAVMGMWLLWWRISRKQRVVETMLLEAAQELEVATSRLDEALEYIQRLKQAVAASQTEPHASKTPPEEKRPAEEASRHEPPSGQITQMLRMRREGKDIDAIAEILNLPKAQVKLLLKLHAAGE
jgi:hypothetical protein